MLSAPRHLRCEYAEFPLASGTATPCLSWWISDDRAAELQSAYEIMAASNADALAVDQADLWRTGRVDSNQCAQVRYDGEPLRSRQRVYWKVRTFDSDGLPSAWSDPAWFETGLLSDGDWQADWIGAPQRGSLGRAVPVPAMRCEFVLTRQIRSARLYIAALGDFHLEINGNPIAADVSHAGWTDFGREAHYQCFDVAQQLLVEPNAIGVLLGDGYFAGDIPPFGRCNYGDRPLLRLQLEITDTDGQLTTICSDADWAWRPSWILSGEPGGPEHVDQRQFVDGWSFAGLAADGWQPVDVVALGELSLHPQHHPSMRVQQALRPTVPGLTGRGTGARGHREWISVDFGEQLTGRLEFSALCRRTDLIRVHYCAQEDFVDVVTDTFTVSDGVDALPLTPCFATHQFRYVRIEYSRGSVDISEIRALRMAAADTQGCKLRCDHVRINQLVEAAARSAAALAGPVPMSGIGREQRIGDVGAWGCWLPWAAHHPGIQPLLRKWLADTGGVRPGIEHAGAYAPIIPRARVGGWQDEIAEFEAIAATLWRLYLFTGEVDELLGHYGGLRAAALSFPHHFDGHLRNRCRADLYGSGDEAGLVAGCTLLGALTTVIDIAQVLQRHADAELLQRLAENVRSAVRGRYVSVDGHLAANGQSGCVAALYHGLLEPDELAAVQGRLVQLMQRNTYHVDVCPVLVHAVLPVLTLAGRLDVAYMVLLQTSPPGWLGSIEAGATLLERVPGEFDMAQYGVWQWLLESLVGLVPLAPSADQAAWDAMREVRIQPMPPLGKQFQAGSPVEQVEFALATLHGEYEVAWHIHAERFELSVLVPPGCRARVIMPDGVERNVGGGRHRFTMDFDAGGDGIPTLLNVAHPRR